MNMLKVVRNLTPKRLRIEGEDGQWLVLAPLGTSGPVDDKAGLAPFRLERLMLQNLVSVEDVPATEKFEWVFQLALAVGFVYLVFGTQLIGEVAKSHPTVAEYSVHLWIGGALVIVLCLALVVAITWKGREVVQRVAAQFFSLFLILATGIGLPALAIFYFGGVRGLIHGALSLELLGRLLQLVFIATASLLPALLYFLFDRQQLGTLRQRFEQQIFRLDPSVKTLTDVRARYGQQIEEAYGAVREVRLIRGTRWPILVATLVLAIGWILTLLPVGDASKVSDPAQLWRFFEPQPTLVAFGFLGSYFFALNMVLRRYVRGDLKPKAYSGIVVRIFVVVVLAWVVGLLFPDNTPRHTMGLILVFFIGIVPETGLTFLRESLSSHRGLGWTVPSLEERQPLTALEGIDLYERSRLMDEGVTNVQGLAHHDLIDLMLETRIPAPRLVDWIDQAILYLHLGVGASEDAKAVAARQRLRSYGIRTATNLEQAVEASEQRGRPGQGGKQDQPDAAEAGRLLGLLNEPTRGDEPLRIRVILDSLKDDEWLAAVRYWRKKGEVEEEVVTLTPSAAA